MRIIRESKLTLKVGSNLNSHLNSCKRLLAFVLLLNKSPDAEDKRFLMISLGVSWRFPSGSSEDRKVHSESSKLLEAKTTRRLNSRRVLQSLGICLSQEEEF